MQTNNRNRLIWTLVAVTAAYGILNVLVFYVTNSFGPFWFTASLLVYGALLVAAVALAFVDREAPSPVTPAPAATIVTPAVAQPVATLAVRPTVPPAARRELVYEGGDARIVRESRGDDEELIVITGSGTRRMRDIEAEIELAEEDEGETVALEVQAPYAPKEARKA